MSWYNSQEGQNAHILWSKVRYTRNLAKTPFGFKCECVDRDRFLSRLCEIMNENGFHEEHLPHGTCAEVLSLAEKQFIDHSFAESNYDRELYFNEPCNLTIYAGGDFHLSIQALLCGSALYEAYKIASEAEEMLDGEFEFAYSDSLGYLASEVSRCGSGLEISVALFLPTARHGARYNTLHRLASAYGAVLSPMMAKYDNAGDIYLLTLIPSRVKSEKRALLDFSELLSKIIEDEIVSERIIFSSKSTIISDKAWRALGTLASARAIDEEELLSLLSRIRLSLALEATKSSAPPITLTLLSSLLADGLNGALVASCGSCESLDDCRVNRAREIKHLLLPICEEMIKAAI